MWDGRTISIDYLSAGSRGDRFPALSAECLRLKADIIVVTTTPAAQPAEDATHAIPIVMIPLGDPVATSFVESLARPGGNITWTDIPGNRISAKRLELPKGAASKISRVLMPSYPADPIAAPQVKELESAAGLLGVKLLPGEIQSADAGCVRSWNK
jgi:putative tryptophan/tyrosine transport system substrate-binding protein